MKNNKTDSDILNDNYFSKKEKPKYFLLKIIGFTFLNFLSFFLSYVTSSIILWLIHGESDSGSQRIEEIMSLLLVNHFPFILPILIFGFQIKKNISNDQFEKTKWKYWVIILTFFSYLGFRYFIEIT